MPVFKALARFFNHPLPPNGFSKFKKTQEGKNLPLYSLQYYIFFFLPRVENLSSLHQFKEWQTFDKCPLCFPFYSSNAYGILSFSITSKPRKRR